jgi:hypothetical protein
MLGDGYRLSNLVGLLNGLDTVRVGRLADAQSIVRQRSPSSRRRALRKRVVGLAATSISMWSTYAEVAMLTRQ